LVFVTQKPYKIYFAANTIYINFEPSGYGVLVPLALSMTAPKDGTAPWNVVAIHSFCERHRPSVMIHPSPYWFFTFWLPICFSYMCYCQRRLVVQTAV